MATGLRMLVFDFSISPSLSSSFLFPGPCTCLTSILPLSCTRNQNASSDTWHTVSTIDAITKHCCMTSLKAYWQVAFKAINTYTLDVMCSYYVRQGSSGSWSSDECRTHGRPEFLPEPSPPPPLCHQKKD